MAHFELQGFISEAARIVRHLSAGRELSVLWLPVCKWTLSLYSSNFVKCCGVHVSSWEGLLLIPLAHLERGFYFNSQFEWLIHVLVLYIHKYNPLITWFPTSHRHGLRIALSTINFHHYHHGKLSSGVLLIRRKLLWLLAVFSVVEWVALCLKNTSGRQKRGNTYVQWWCQQAALGNSSQTFSSW